MGGVGGWGELWMRQEPACVVFSAGTLCCVDVAVDALTYDAAFGRTVCTHDESMVR